MNEYDAWSAKRNVDLEAFGALFIRLTGQIVRNGPFPFPSGYSRWSDEAVAEVAGRVYAAKKKQLALRVLQQAKSQQSLELIILTTVRNALIDEAKGTETGKLRLRLRRVLGEDSRFLHLDSPAECWALVAGSQVLWQGDIDDLIDAALGVRGYTITTWNTSGPTAGPVKMALREVSHGVLTYAEGAVRDQDLATVLRERFVLIAPLKLVTSEAITEQTEPQDEGTTAPGVEDVRTMAVAAVWELLDDTERAALAYAGQGEPAGTWARAVSLGPAQAELVEQRLLEKLRLGVTKDEDAPSVLRELQQRSLAESLGPPEIRRLLLMNPGDKTEGEADG